VAAYCVYFSRSDDAASPKPTDTRFVRDGFSWPAALLGPVWCVFQRGWTALTLWAIGAGSFAIAVASLNLTPLNSGLIAGLLLILFGHEATSLIGRSLESKFENMIVIEGHDLESAERRFFRISHGLTSPRAEGAGLPKKRLSPSGIGLFIGRES
jgi:Protein of unknown function (DUF2628)